MVMRICVHFVAVLLVLVVGCASPNVNPKKPAPGKGYVDFYLVPNEPVCWQIVRMDDPSGKPVKLSEEFEPSEERILRLALPPGEYYLRVSFLNHVVMDPAHVVVEVKDGKVTPVQVTFTEVGKTQVEVRTVRVGGTVYGTYGRGTKLRLRAYGALKVNANPRTPVPYELKANMPYVQTATNLMQLDSATQTP
jgi:hypothetical protein